MGWTGIVLVALMASPAGPEADLREGCWINRISGWEDGPSELDVPERCATFEVLRIEPGHRAAFLTCLVRERQGRLRLSLGDGFRILVGTYALRDGAFRARLAFKASSSMRRIPDMELRGRWAAEGGRLELEGHPGAFIPLQGEPLFTSELDLLLGKGR